jgi:RHS repeat-associated protein
MRTQASADLQPPVVYALAREIHTADLLPDQPAQIQHVFSYSDGFGREIQRKTQTEAGPLVDGGPDVAPRWVSSGWTIFNNKGKPVRQYEPFFCRTHLFEFANKVGVSPILCYDPVHRLVATLHPNHTHEKVAFDPWHQNTWDVNDTVDRLDPKTDPDIGFFFERLPDDDYLPTWLAQRRGNELGTAEQSAASKAAVHANTPTAVHLDVLGRPIHTVTYNRFLQDGTVFDAKYSTRIALDIAGNQLSVADALGRTVITYAYGLLKGALHSSSVDAGDHWTLNDVSHTPIREWNSRGFESRHAYDALRRPTHLYVRPLNAVEFLAEFTLYGEMLTSGETQNLRSRVYQHYDEAGVATNIAFDFKGNRTLSSQQLAILYRGAVDWSPLATLKDAGQIANAGAPLLESETFRSSSTFDALNRLASTTTPDGSTARLTFNEANLLKKVTVSLRNGGTPTPLVADIDYNPKQQRTLIAYGNGALTVYRYDPSTFRLSEMKTTRTADKAVLQDLIYSYDPIGNITSIGDAAQQTIYFRNQIVTANSGYVYDAIYRTISADGREHIGQLSQPQTDWDDAPRINQPLPTDGQAMRNYAENYSYDAVGNVLQIIHLAINGSWTRSYAYDEPNSRPTNNRLTSSAVGALKERYEYDAHGNTTQIPHLHQISWDFRDQLASTQRQVVNAALGETTYYVYDASGRRVRKVTQSSNGTKTNELIYLNGYEVYREYASDGSAVTLERQTLHVMDDKRCIALIETNNTTGAAPILRYQFNNHVGSTCLELDGRAAIISYEEYYPYGSSSFRAVASDVEVSAKRYRYAGMERDEETGLNYHGARYYAPWLGRWISPDPVGIEDDLNMFCYSKSAPTTRKDANGHQSARITIDSEVVLVDESGKIKSATKTTSVEKIDKSGKRTVLKQSSRDLNKKEKAKAQTRMDNLKKEMEQQKATEAKKQADKEKEQRPYKLVIAINISSVDKKETVQVSGGPNGNPGHTFVEIKDPDGKVIKTLSYGPTAAYGLAQVSCSRPATGTYKLDKGDKFDAFEWDINKAQSEEAIKKIDEIQTNPGTYSGTHQCTSVALEVSDAAGLTSIPRGTGNIEIPVCADAKNVPTPYHLDKALKEEKKPFRLLQTEDFADTGLPVHTPAH